MLNIRSLFRIKMAKKLLDHQGLCHWTPLGAPPPDTRYRLALRALAMVRHPYRKSWIRPWSISTIQCNIMQYNTIRTIY